MAQLDFLFAIKACNFLLIDFHGRNPFISTGLLLSEIVMNKPILNMLQLMAISSHRFAKFHKTRAAAQLGI